MKISQPTDISVALSSNPAALAAKNGPTASTLAKTSASKSTQSAGVAVTVSTMARSLEAPAAGGSPDVDLGKVALVRTAIEQGTFAVNPEAIADAMLSDVKENFQRGLA